MSSPIYPKQLGIFSLLILNHILPGMMKRGNFYDQNGGFNNNRFGPQRFSVGYKLWSEFSVHFRVMLRFEPSVSGEVVMMQTNEWQ